MATTTNYGWTTPDDTALVKDGAAAIRTLGSSVDTTTKALNPSTTLGDIEYRSSTANTNTRLAIGTSGQNLTVVAGAPSWAASATSVLTTTGDTLYASAANTLARLGIGSTGQVLTVAGGVPTWAAAAGGAGNMVQIATGSLSGASLQITGLTSYTDILVLFYETLNNTANGNYRVQLNSTATDHNTFGPRWNGTAFNTGNYLATTDFFTSTDAILRTDNNNLTAFKLTNCKNAGFTDIDTYSTYLRSGSGQGVTFAKGIYTKSEAVSTIDIKNTGGTWSGGTYEVWGA